MLQMSLRDAFRYEHHLKNRACYRSGGHAVYLFVSPSVGRHGFRRLREPTAGAAGKPPCQVPEPAIIAYQCNSRHSIHQVPLSTFVFLNLTKVLHATERLSVLS